MKISPPDAVEIRNIAGKGRGVFPRHNIPAGTIFERAPLLIIPSRDVLGPQTGVLLSNYIFEYGRGRVALALGYGSLYNHSWTPNARYQDAGRRVKEFVAVSNISAGEEITINYNGDSQDLSPVAFDVL